MRLGRRSCVGIGEVVVGLEVGALVVGEGADDLLNGGDANRRSSGRQRRSLSVSMAVQRSPAFVLLGTSGRNRRPRRKGRRSAGW